MSDSQYTTDSVPSPPRDKENIYVSTEKNKAKVTMDGERIQNESRNSTLPPKFTSNAKPNQQTPVINMLQVISSPGAHIGHVFNYTWGKKDKFDPEVIKETETMAALKKSKKPVTEKDIDVVKDYIGSNYNETFRKLGYSQPEIDQNKDNFPQNINGLIRFLLVDWIRVNGRACATVDLLANALWDSKQQEALKVWSLKYDELHK